jgi:hypothetical protein
VQSLAPRLPCTAEHAIIYAPTMHMQHSHCLKGPATLACERAICPVTNTGVSGRLQAVTVTMVGQTSKAEVIVLKT